MRKIFSVFAIVVLISISGCAVAPFRPLATQASASPEALSRSSSEFLPAFSLIDADGAFMGDSIAALLMNIEAAIPDNARIAVVQVPSVSQRWSYSSFGLSEDEFQMKQAWLDTLRTQLIAGGAEEVKLVPTILVPTKPTVEALREVGVLLQADAVLVFQVTSDVFQNYRLFRDDQLKVYASCEALILDTRTGLIPFTTLITRDYFTQRQDDDLNDSDARRRAEQHVVLLSLGGLGWEVGEFLRQR